MKLIKKFFKTTQRELTPPKKKQASGFISWLCAGSSPKRQQQIDQRVMKTINVEQSQKKSQYSTPETSNTRINIQIASSNDQSLTQIFQYDLKSQLIEIVNIEIEKIENLLQNKQQQEIYAMINNDQQLFQMNQQYIWFKIGKNEQLNSLLHIKPYFFDKIFMAYDQFGSQFSIQQIVKSKQNIYLNLVNPHEIQLVIDTYQKQLIKNFGFKVMSEWINKIKITIYRTRNNNLWLKFNQKNIPDFMVQNILLDLEFQKDKQDYELLKQQIPKSLIFDQYKQFIQNKQKPDSKKQYLRNKFISKLRASNKNLTPRNQSPQNGQVISKTQTEQYYEQYILSINTNTLPKQFEAFNGNRKHYKQNQSNSQDKDHTQQEEQQIFQFNVYKDQRQQQAKRVAINRERKIRSKSQDITANDLDNMNNASPPSDYFDQKY